MHVVGPEFCGGALSKGGNMVAINADNVGGLIQSKILNMFILNVANIFSHELLNNYIISIHYDLTCSLILGNVFMIQTLAGGGVNKIAVADDQDAVQWNANSPVSGYSIRYQQSPCMGPTQA